MASTTSFNWETPDDTDLVKDGAAAIRTLGNSIDTSMTDLLGGTTGQVLAKASNTNMDFTWVAQDDSNAIQNAIVDAKGDLIAASAADTPARLAVGNNGETLVADSSTATGLRYQSNFAAGKNKIINGDFGIWQRSTSVTVLTDADYYAPDRFASTYVGAGATVTWSRQTFTAGTAPVAGYEGTYFSRLSGTSATSSTEMGCNQRIEDVRTFAGQTATFSFWAKADSARTCTILLLQVFGSGGSGTVTALNTTQALTTSWARYSFTVAVPSIAGKTIGTNSSLRPYVYYTTGQATGSPQLDTWGWQLEAGSVATAFQTATGTIQGELAACQRYYQLIEGGPFGSVQSSVYYGGVVPFAVPMRTVPTQTWLSTISAYGFPTTTGSSITPTVRAMVMYKAANATIGGAYFQDQWSLSAEL